MKRIVFTAGILGGLALTVAGQSVNASAASRDTASASPIGQASSVSGPVASEPMVAVVENRIRLAVKDNEGGGYTQHGKASYYWQPQRVASGGWFNPNAMTAAHKSLPFGTRVRVTHKGNGRSVVVTINDRGPYIAGRIIDLSKAAAAKLGMLDQGVASVVVRVIGRD